MLHRFAPFAPVLAAMLVSQMAMGLMGPLIPLLLVAEGETATRIGMVASAYALGFGVGALGGGAVVRRLGHARAFALFATLAALATLALAATEGASAWIGMRGLIGFGNAGLCVVAEGWLNARAGNANRGRVLSAYLLVTWGGGALAPLAIQVAGADAWLFIPAALAFLAAILPMYGATGPALAPDCPMPARVPLLVLWRAAPSGLVCCAAAGLCNGVFYALAPVYLAALEMEVGPVALFMSTVSLAGLAVQMPVGFAADRMGRAGTAVALMAVATAAAVLFALAGAASWLLLAGIGAVFAAATAPLYGLGVGLLGDRLTAGEAVAASGTLLLIWALAAAIGPVVAGWAIGWLGPAGMFAYLAAVTIAMGLFTGAWMLLGTRPMDADMTGTQP